jgi:hypothetical protein
MFGGSAFEGWSRVHWSYVHRLAALADEERPRNTRMDMTLSHPASATCCNGHVPVEIAGTTLGRYRHICAFFRHPQDEYRIMLPFIKDGLDRGDRTCQIVEPTLRDEHRRQLTGAGIDVALEERTGRLEVISAQDVYLHDGHFDVARMLDVIRQHISPESESSISRITGHSEWVGEDLPGVEDFLEYESRLNDVIPEGRDTVVCLYDLSRTSAALVVDVMRTHPMVIVGGVLHENPFFTPVERFLSELRERKDLSRA